jgi:hypothetical protein
LGQVCVGSGIALKLELTKITSTPREMSAWVAGFVKSRETARIVNFAAVLGSSSIDLMTEPPWIPVAPNTTRIFLLDIVEIAQVWYEGSIFDRGVLENETWAHK